MGWDGTKARKGPFTRHLAWPTQKHTPFHLLVPHEPGITHPTTIPLPLLTPSKFPPDSISPLPPCDGHPPPRYDLHIAHDDLGGAQWLPAPFWGTWGRGAHVPSPGPHPVPPRWTPPWFHPRGCGYPAMGPMCTRWVCSEPMPGVGGFRTPEAGVPHPLWPRPYWRAHSPGRCPPSLA